MRWVWLFSGTNKVEMRFRRCQAHPHFVVNSKKSLVFCFYFLSEQKIHIHRAVNMPIPRIILISLHRSLNRICKQMAKSRPSCFGETMHEKTGRFVRQWAAWAFAEFFPGGDNIDSLLIVLLTNGRSVKDLSILYRKKIRHESTCSLHILFKIVFRLKKRIQVCQKGALSVIRYSFCWIDV